MVVVKVRETYDLHTTENKMTVIGIHTPKPDIIKKNYPGLLMQCKMYRPVSCDVRLACASVLPLDPLGVGTAPGDVAPEDVFNPILYKACSNKGMSQLEGRISALNTLGGSNFDVDGNSAVVEVDDTTPKADEFGIYYGLLSNTHEWRHANPQAGLEMTGLKPLVYELVYNVGEEGAQLSGSVSNGVPYMGPTGYKDTYTPKAVLGDSKPFPWLNCTAFSAVSAKTPGTYAEPGFSFDPAIYNSMCDVPWLNVMCGVIIVPPSRLHSLYFRLVIEWSLEFSRIRPLGDLVGWTSLENIGTSTHYQNYSYDETKKAVTGDSETILENDACMVSTNADVKKVM